MFGSFLASTVYTASQSICLSVVRILGRQSITVRYVERVQMIQVYHNHVHKFCMKQLSLTITTVASTRNFEVISGNFGHSVPLKFCTEIGL